MTGRSSPPSQRRDGGPSLSPLITAKLYRADKVCKMIDPMVRRKAGHDRAGISLESRSTCISSLEDGSPIPSSAASFTDPRPASAGVDERSRSGSSSSREELSGRSGPMVENFGNLKIWSAQQDHAAPAVVASVVPGTPSGTVVHRRSYGLVKTRSLDVAHVDALKEVVLVVCGRELLWGAVGGFFTPTK